MQSRNDRHHSLLSWLGCAMRCSWSSPFFVMRWLERLLPILSQGMCHSENMDALSMAARIKALILWNKVNIQPLAFKLYGQQHLIDNFLNGRKIIPVSYTTGRRTRHMAITSKTPRDVVQIVENYKETGSTTFQKDCPYQGTHNEATNRHNKVTASAHQIKW